MSSQNQIVVSPNPLGHFIEGTLTAVAILPGTHVSIDTAGLYEAWNESADGVKGEVIVLIEDALQGRDVSTTYDASDRFFAYIPLPGDELQCLFKNISGTADSFVIGELVMIDDTTGKLITESSSEMEPWAVMETIAALTADALHLVRSTGH